MEWVRSLTGTERVVVFTGAGVSTESGLATFRGSDGLWEGHRVEDVASPEGFTRDPGLVWSFYEMRREQAKKAEPNPAHRAIAELQRMLVNFTLITQNVDGLHQRGGSTGVLEVHGSLWNDRCDACGFTAHSESLVHLSFPPTCPNCGSLVRPTVVWFGEGLPEDVFREAALAVMDANVLLVVGTSAQVYPAAGFIPMAKRAGALIVEVNPDASAMSDLADVTIREPAGVALPRIVDLLKLKSPFDQ